MFSRSISIKGTVKETIQPINEPILVGGELIRPGDVIRGDADGVVVVRKEDLASAIERSEAREIAEQGYFEQFRAGKTPIEVSGLGPVLAAMGFTTD